MASFDRVGKSITCPDCLGSAKVKVTLGTGEEILIECGGCDPGGYQGSTGRIPQYDYAVKVARRTITGVNLREDNVEYSLDGEHGQRYIGYQEGDYTVFATEDDAKVGGEALRAKYEAEENKRLLAKTKNHRSWSFNTNYHRQQIKQLESQLAYHHSKVEICKAKAKEGG
jgi:hypothetical protein